jgi:cytochrome c oxidase assembly protein subunit 15
MPIIGRARTRGGIGMERALRWLSAAATAGMFLVLLMGAAVTNTGSAEGCGRSWPLCHGQFIPEFAFTTAVEFAHRAVTGVVGLLVAALAIGSWARWRQRREIAVLAPLMLAFLLLQSGLGAWAVLYPQSPTVLALHFGISLISFASVLLTAIVIREAPGGDPRDANAPPRFRAAIWAVLAYVYLVVYLGAYVRHTGASLACTDWPLCNGALVPPLVGPIAAVFAHRVAALLAVLALAGLALWARRLRPAHPHLARASALALGLALLQALSGALVVGTRMGLWSTLAHAGLMTLLFGALSYLCLRTLRSRAIGVEGRRSRQSLARSASLR